MTTALAFPHVSTICYDILRLSHTINMRVYVRSNPLDVAGRKVGIAFDPSRRFINTVAAHRLMAHVSATAPEKADPLMEALFHAYFEQAKDVSRPEELLAVARLVGVEGEGLEELVQASSVARRDEVMASVRDSQTRLRVTGVPFFLIEPRDGGRPMAFSGAQVSS